MKVLKKGTQSPDFSVEVTCKGNRISNSGCGALLLVEQADIYLAEYGSGMDDYTEVLYVFTCPECGKENALDKAKQPDGRLDFPTKRAWKIHQRKAKAAALQAQNLSLPSGPRE